MIEMNENDLKKKSSPSFSVVTINKTKALASLGDVLVNSIDYAGLVVIAPGTNLVLKKIID